jgi:hypothetical protein
MRWDERIDVMEQQGEASDLDRHLVASWSTCLVGEALEDVGQNWKSDLPVKLRACLMMLGGDILQPLEHPLILLNRKDWPALRQRLADIRQVVSEFYPPPKLWTPTPETEKQVKKALA